MNSVSWAIWRSDSCIRFAIVPRIPLSRMVRVGSCDAGSSAGAGAVDGAEPPAIRPRTWRATASFVMRCSTGSIGTCARSTPRRSARLRAAAVAGIEAPVAVAGGRTGWAVTGGAGGEGRLQRGRLSRSAATMRPPGPVPRTVRRSMLRSPASRLVSGDAMTRPVWATAATAAAVAAGAAADGGAAAGAGAAAPGAADGSLFALVEEPADAFAAGEGLADLADAVEPTGPCRFDVGLRLVRLDP